MFPDLIDCSSQHGALARRPLQPLTGGWKGGESHAPPIAVASVPKASPARLFKPGYTWPSDAFRSESLVVVFDCSGQA